MNRLLLLILLGGSVLPGWTAESSGQDSASRHIGYFLGIGAGYQSGSGIQGGIEIGRNWIQAGLGIFYGAEDGYLWYSVGLRGARNLVEGRFINTYAWVGVCAFRGTRPDEDEVERGTQVNASGQTVNELAGDNISPGVGIGIEFHYGIPFHIRIDSGYRLQYGFAEKDKGLQVKPTINASLTYHW